MFLLLIGKNAVLSRLLLFSDKKENFPNGQKSRIGTLRDNYITYVLYHSFLKSARRFRQIFQNLSFAQFLCRALCILHNKQRNPSRADLEKGGEIGRKYGVLTFINKYGTIGATQLASVAVKRNSAGRNRISQDLRYVARLFLTVSQRLVVLFCFRNTRKKTVPQGKA